MGKGELESVNKANAKVETKRSGCVGWICNGAAPVHIVLLTMQFGYAGHQLLTRVALITGLSQFIQAIYRNAIALVIMSPLAYYMEREKRPPLTYKLMSKFFQLGILGIVGSQQLYLAGLLYTSTTFASTMQNAVPVITFVIAVILGMEKVRIDRLDGQAKVFGTLVCVAGAVLMSAYKGPAVFHGWAKEPSNDLHTVFGSYLGGHLDRLGITQWHVGAIFLIINCFSWAVYIIMQGPILKEFPAPASVTAFTYLFGSVQVYVLMLVITGGKVDWALRTTPQIISVTYAGVISSGINFTLQAWAIQKGGALLVSLYTPVQTIIVAILSVIILGDSLYLGSVVGGIGTMSGLFLVTWGQWKHKKKDVLELLADLEGKTDDLEATPHSPTFVSSLTQPLLKEGGESFVETTPKPPLSNSFTFDDSHTFLPSHHMH